MSLMMYNKTAKCSTSEANMSPKFPMIIKTQHIQIVSYRFTRNQNSKGQYEHYKSDTFITARKVQKLELLLFCMQFCVCLQAFQIYSNSFSLKRYSSLDTLLFS